MSKKGNMQKTARRTFWIALCIVLGIGAAGLSAFSFMQPHESKKAEEKEEGQQVLQTAYVEEEAIPASSADDILQKEEEIKLPEDDGFDESGCIRNENGRILEKKQETQGDEVTLLFGGDILFDDSYAVMAALRKRGGIKDCFSQQTLQEMAEADIFMLNNEFTYTDRGAPTPEKKFTFHAKPEHAKMLQELGVDIVSLANNHSYDYGEVSLLDTLTTLEGIDMPYVGAGRNLDEASQTIYYHAGNQKIAYISGTQIERLTNPDTKGATESTPGVFRCLKETEIFDKVAEAKENSDFVIVYIHWGTEGTDKPDWSQPGMAEALAEAGADLIIGDHPHVLQPIANVNDTPVIYSVGNFWFNSSSLKNCLVKVKLKDGEMQSFQFMPARQASCYTQLLNGAEKEAVLKYMRGISKTVTIDEEGFVEFKKTA